MSTGFRHEAVVYTDLDGFVASVGASIHEAVAREEPVLVLVDPVRAAALRDRVGDVGLVRFGDSTAIGRNPARLISTWREFVGGFAGRPVLGVSEAVWPGRSPDELDECLLHEALLNVAFSEGPDWHLLCPYDATHLDAGALALATDHHPVTITGDGSEPTGAGVGPTTAAALFARPLRPAPDGVEPLAFDRPSLVGLRYHVRTEALRFGLAPDRADDFTLAVDEVATNSVVHGGGEGMLRLWLEHRTVICEVTDRGQVAHPLVGRQRPPPDQEGGRGLWMANQLCDLVQVRSPPTGTVARLHMSCP